MFEAKIMTCGMKNCVYCSRGRCELTKVSIGTDGKCSQYTTDKPNSPRDTDPDKEFYPYTNVC